MKPAEHFLLIALIFCLTTSIVCASTTPLAYQTQALKLGGDTYKMRVPQGYQLELLTDDLDGPRLMGFDRQGVLLIGSKSDVVYRLSPPYTRPEILLELNDYPHSVVVREEEILIATTSGLFHAPYTSGVKEIPSSNIKRLARLPGGGGHNSRTLGLGPDGRVYLSLGITSNCADEYLGEAYPFYDRRGGILVLDEKGGQARWKTYASGLRNPVGFDWHPVTGMLYASNNGPDHHGFERPPEYFSRIEAGSFHGMPWFQYDGKRIKRDDCVGSKPPRPVKDVSLPVAIFPARNAPMAVSFVPQGAMEKNLEYDAIVALRGSWGTQPAGNYFGDSATRRHPKLVVVRFDKGKAIRVDDLVTGFQLEDGDRIARPVGVAMGPDGALYFTSDSGVNGLFRLRKISR